MDTTSFDLEMIEQSIEIDLSPYFIDDEFDDNLLAFTWEITSFDDDLLCIKLKF